MLILEFLMIARFRKWLEDKAYLQQDLQARLIASQSFTTKS